MGLDLETLDFDLRFSELSGEFEELLEAWVIFRHTPATFIYVPNRSLLRIAK